MDVMTVDCTRCAVRGPACGDCVISVLLGVPGELPGELDADEQRALGLMAASGLLPPLRLVTAVGPTPEQRLPLLRASP